MRSAQFSEGRSFHSLIFFDGNILVEQYIQLKLNKLFKSGAHHGTLFSFSSNGTNDEDIGNRYEVEGGRGVSGACTAQGSKI